MHRFLALFVLVLASVLGTSLAAAGGIPTTTVISSSNNPSTAGAAVTFTATVTPSTATAATVDFLEGTTVLGNVTPSSPGVYTFTTTALSAGSHDVKARYNGPGGAGSNPSTSSDLTQVVNATAGANAIAVVSSVNPTTFGDSVTFTATTSGGSAPLTVQFRDGGTAIGAPVPGTGATFNTFAFTTTALNAGTHAITARFNAGGNVTSPAVSQVVNQATNTAATLASSKNPSGAAESVTFTAGVTAGGGGVPTGTMTLKDTFNGATTTLATITLAAGTGTFTTTTLASGSHSVVATYGGDTNYAAGATATVVQLVDAAGSATALTSSVNPSVAGQPVTLTAKVTTSVPSTLTGKITFAEGGTELGVVAVAANGTASLAVPNFSAASHALTATYGNDAAVKSSTGSLTQVVAKAQSTVTLSSSSSSSVTGAPVTFSAVVKVTAPGSGKATGNVTFKDGGTVIGTVAVDGNGVATFKTSTLGTAEHTITASYAGDARVNPSQATVTQSVSPGATTVAVTTSPSTSHFGEAVTITATVTSASGQPTGSVTFKSGTTTLGTGALNAGSATLTTTEIPVGSSTLTVDYDGGVLPKGSGSVVHVVEKGDATITLASSANPSVLGKDVTITATFKPSALVTGMVEIFADDKSLGTFPIAKSSGTFTTKDLAVGAHPIRVAYAGDEQFNEASATLTQTVTATAPAPDGSSSSTTSSGGGDAAKTDDDGCHVATVGSSTTSRMLSFAAVAMGLILAIRRRRRR